MTSTPSVPNLRRDALNVAQVPFDFSLSDNWRENWPAPKSLLYDESLRLLDELSPYWDGCTAEHDIRRMSLSQLQAHYETELNDDFESIIIDEAPCTTPIAIMNDIRSLNDEYPGLDSGRSKDDLDSHLDTLLAKKREAEPRCPEISTWREYWPVPGYEGNDNPIWQRNRNVRLVEVKGQHGDPGQAEVGLVLPTPREHRISGGVALCDAYVDLGYFPPVLACLSLTDWETSRGLSDEGSAACRHVLSQVDASCKAARQSIGVRLDQ